MLAALELCDTADQKTLLQDAPAIPVRVPDNGSRAATAMDRLARDPDSSHLSNYPFALTVFILLMLGAVVTCAGLIVPDVGATMIGFLLTLLGTAPFCGRLPGE